MNRRIKSLFTLTDILGLHKHLGALMLGGRVFRLSREKVGPDEPDHTELHGARRRVEAVAMAEDVFYERLHTHSEAVDAFRGRVLGAPQLPRRQLHEELGTRAQRHAILHFAVHQLVPHFKALAENRVLSDRTGGLQDLEPVAGDVAHLAALTRTPSDVIGEVVGGDALFLGQSVYDIAWVNGRVRPRDCFLQAEGECYSVQTRSRRDLMALEGAFRKKLHGVLRGHIFEAENEFLLAQAQQLASDLQRASDAAQEDQVLYRDRERCILLGPQQSVFCCQDIPAFAMECSDRRLRLFDRVRAGIELRSLDAQDIVWGGGVVMQPYEHVFVGAFGRVGHLCLGDASRLWARFEGLPLCELVVEMLNAVRLVMCAGHFDAGQGERLGGYCMDQGLSRPVISVKEARERGYPIYSFYRGENTTWDAMRVSN